MPGWLIVVVALAVVGAVAYLRWRAEQQRRQALASFALSKGWSYAASNPRLVDAWQGTPFGQGDHRRTANVITGETSGLPLTAFDYSYQTHSSDSKGNRSTQTHRYTICALRLPAYLPGLEVTTDNVLRRLGDALGFGDDVELESEDFNRRFRVSARDRKFATDVLNPRTMELLLARRPLRWRITGADILSWDDGQLTPTRLLEVSSTLAAVVAGVPSFVWRDAGLQPGRQPGATHFTGGSS